jgi:hypothetical protein
MKITRILKVVDTREYQEVGDKWEPIPGSGDEHECSRCGRLHEIHALVELENGGNAIVGTGCMRADESEVQRRAKSLTSTAKTLRRNQAELAAIRAKQAAWDKAEAEVMAMPAAVQIVEAGELISHGRKYCKVEYRVNGWQAAMAYDESRERINDQEKTKAAIFAWRRHIIKQTTGEYSRPDSYYIEQSIAKAEKRLATITQA